MARAILLVMDSVGIGGAPDAQKFGDEGADTLGHIAAACAAGAGDALGIRSGSLRIPVMNRLGEPPTERRLVYEWIGGEGA